MGILRMTVCNDDTRFAGKLGDLRHREVVDVGASMDMETNSDDSEFVADIEKGYR